MPSWGIRCLAEFQENFAVSENYCYSNYYSEMSGNGLHRSLSNPVCGLRAWGWEAPCVVAGVLPVV